MILYNFLKKIEHFYLYLKKKFFSYYFIQTEVFFFSGFVLHYYKTNWFAYFDILNQSIWYFYILILLYHDMYSFYIFIFYLFFFFILFYNLWLPRYIIKNCLVLFIIANQDKSEFYNKSFSFFIITILLFCSLLNLPALPYIRILFCTKSFIDLVTFIYKMHLKVQIQVLERSYISDPELHRLLFPSLNSEEDIGFLLENKFITNEEAENLRLKRKN